MPLQKCPTCDTNTIKYNKESNIFYCTECSFYALAEDSYGCTFLRGHVRLQKECNK
jgi:ribosomal protein L37AE/L43A